MNKLEKIEELFHLLPTCNYKEWLDKFKSAQTDTDAVLFSYGLLLHLADASHGNVQVKPHSFLVGLGDESNFTRF